jgi:integrase
LTQTRRQPNLEELSTAIHFQLNLGQALRKTFADRIYERFGRDLIKVQRALGHKSINSTVSYLSFREEEITEAILSI